MRHNSWPTNAPQAYLPYGSSARLDLLPTILRALGGMIRDGAERVERWRRHRKTLHALSRLDALVLKDIGLSGGYGAIDAAATAIAQRSAVNENHRSRAA